MKNYLIFRTDTIGDFLLTAILINSIKRNDPNSKITIISSIKNYSYIKSFPIVDRVILLKNNLFNKIKLIIKLRSEYYDYIIIHDAKKRSKFISIFLKYRLKIIPNNNLDISHITKIKRILLKLNFDFIVSDLDTLKNRNYNSTNIKYKNFILFHFDEKWIHSDYISEYTNIEPSKDAFISFINLLLTVSNKKLIITTGMNCPNILNDILDNNLDSRIKIYKKLTFLDLENLISKCSLLISCHGSVSHVAAAHNIKQIDIIDGKKLNFYSRWTAHFRCYLPLYRKKFSELSKQITQLL